MLIRFRDWEDVDMGIYFCNTTNCPGHTSFSARCAVVTRDYSDYDYPALNIFKDMLNVEADDSTPTEPVEIDTEPAEPLNRTDKMKASTDFMDKSYRSKKLRVK